MVCRSCSFLEITTAALQLFLQSTTISPYAMLFIMMTILMLLMMSTMLIVIAVVVVMMMLWGANSGYFVVFCLI